MYGLNAIKTIGIRIGQDLNEKIERSTRLLKLSSSDFTRAALDEFFNGTHDLKKELKAAERRNSKK